MSNNKIKNLILFYLFLMFSNFNTKEIFEEWEDNTQYIYDSNLEDSYSFLSYSIDNETDSKIYLDEKYIYIIKKIIIKMYMKE